MKIVVLKTLREKRLNNLDVDLLISAGLTGYTQALRRFDPTRQVKFKTYAEYRIKGAVLDEVRKLIGDERCKNKRPRQVDFNFDLMGDGGEMQDSLESLMDIETLFNMMPLEERDAGLLRLRVEGYNLKEIGEKYGLSESRASQLLLEIKQKILPWFKDYLGNNFNVVDYKCPICGVTVRVLKTSVGFECDGCSSDIAIVQGEPIQMNTEIEREA